MKSSSLLTTMVSRETYEDLTFFVGELTRWQGIKNLVGPQTLDNIWNRHVLDSLQLLTLAPKARIWLDLGSGAGFPGLILALALKGQKNSCINLVESNGRKCAFLRHIIRETRAPAVVHVQRIESYMAISQTVPDAITARALAPLSQLLNWSQNLLRDGAEGLFLKGKEVQSELTQAQNCWTFTSELVASLTDSSAKIVRITNFV
jgi:16S rRNA (guanine527-N7)-methyltransferase